MVIEIDILDFILGACLLQKHQDVQYLVVYYSRKIILLELNYNIYNKELLGIVTVLKKQRVFLHSTIEPFKVITDYKNLVGFLTTKKLNQKQVRQAEKLIEYYFEIKYTKRTKNTRADTLNKKTEL